MLYIPGVAQVSYLHESAITMTTQVIIFSCIIFGAVARPQGSSFGGFDYRTKSSGLPGGAAHTSPNIAKSSHTKSNNAAVYQIPGSAAYQNAASSHAQIPSAGSHPSSAGIGYSNPAPAHQSPASVAYQAPAYQGYDQGLGVEGYQSLESPGYTVGGGIQFSGLTAEDQKKLAAHEHDGTSFHGPNQPHTFGYAVEDSYYGNQHAHNEYSDGQTTKGSYRVLLPDGRTQIVTYSADAKNGFMAQVSYEGKAKPYQHPQEKTSPGYQPQNPGYKTQQEPAYQPSVQYRPSA
ncbi:hypothetical protein OTU49_006104 [Cherax quadricarinatus]|uniref:Uncharacterized protein n=1 Tax=Cherax quadricarinatus TaxID=27406 RepID=A0AAW0X3R0_CHEQU